MSADDKTEQRTEQEGATSVPDVEPTAVEIDNTSGGADETPAEPGKAPRISGTGVGWPRVNVVPVVLVLLLVVSGGLAAWLYFFQYRPDEQTDAAAKQAAVDAARDGTVALLSYKTDTLDQDFAAAKSHLGGDFLNYYNQFTEQIVSPAAKEKALTTTAKVVRAAVSGELRSDSAVVLVFVNQSTTSKDRPEPSMTASSVLVTVTKVQDKWLITKFDPV